MARLQILAKNMDRKKQIRKDLIRRRQSLSKDDTCRKSISITKKLLTIPEFCSADRILSYCDYKNEVITDFISDYAWKNKVSISFPRVEDDLMEFYEVKGKEDLVLGKWNIREPGKTCPYVVSTDEKVVMIVPCTGADAHGNRIGYGGGYYDRYFEKHPQFLKILVCYEMQMLDQVPVEEHDLKVDYIVTEDRIVKIKS